MIFFTKNSNLKFEFLFLKWGVRGAGESGFFLL